MAAEDDSSIQVLGHWGIASNTQSEKTAHYVHQFTAGDCREMQWLHRGNVVMPGFCWV